MEKCIDEKRLFSRQKVAKLWCPNTEQPWEWPCLLHCVLTECNACNCQRQNQFNCFVLYWDVLRSVPFRAELLLVTCAEIAVGHGVMDEEWLIHLAEMSSPYLYWLSLLFWGGQMSSRSHPQWSENHPGHAEYIMLSSYGPQSWSVVMSR